MNDDVVRRAGRYLVAGIVAAGIYWATVLVLVEQVRLSAVVAAVLATVVVIITSYVVNRAWVFNTNRPHVSAFSRFVAASVVSIVVNTGLMYIAVDLLGWRYVVGLILATLVVPPINFIVNYRWTFRATNDMRDRSSPGR